jgi:hypothetical protein
MNRRRLDFETMRDAILAVGSQLDRRIGGPSVKEIVSPTATRRTLYGFIDRLNLSSLYRTFDFPDPNATSPKRDETTIAPQALFWLNHPFPRQAAARVLEQTDVKSNDSTETRVRSIYRLLFGREPDDDEQRLARDFLQDRPLSDGRWNNYVRALLLSNEFVFVD